MGGAIRQREISLKTSHTSEMKRVSCSSKTPRGLFLKAHLLQANLIPSHCLLWFYFALGLRVYLLHSLFLCLFRFFLGLLSSVDDTFLGADGCCSCEGLASSGAGRERLAFIWRTRLAF